MVMSAEQEMELERLKHQNRIDFEYIRAINQKDEDARKQKRLDTLRECAIQGLKEVRFD